MSDTVNVTATAAYQNNIEMVLQQSKAQLLDAVEVQEGLNAEAEAVKDLVGNAMPQEADERYGDLKETGVNHDRIWLTKPNELYFMEYVDGADQLGTTIGLTGAYTMAGTATINRSWDDQILLGIYSGILSGKTIGSATLTPFPNGQVVPVTTGGAAGPQRFNTAKLRAAGKILDKGFVDPLEKRYMVIDAEQNDDLLSEVPATSADFKGAFGGEFDNGKIKRMLGFEFIHLELNNPLLRVASKFGLTTDANGYTKNPFWARSGVRLGIWQKVRTAIKDQPSKVNTSSVFAGTTIAATRTQAGKVGIVLNSEQ